MNIEITQAHIDARIRKRLSNHGHKQLEKINPALMYMIGFNEALQWIYNLQNTIKDEQKTTNPS